MRIIAALLIGNRRYRLKICAARDHPYASVYLPLPREWLHLQPCHRRPPAYHFLGTRPCITIALCACLDDCPFVRVHLDGGHSLFDAVHPQAQGPNRAFAIAAFERVGVDTM